jgi:uncharacterized membrane protein YGL010W
MNHLFQRQLATYAQYHRHPHNCATHYVGIPMLFLAVILPLQALRIPVAHHEVPLAIILTLPAMVVWLLLDLGVGAALLLLLCPLFIVAEFLVRLGFPLIWWISASLFIIGWFFQLLGHSAFEGRRPAFLDDMSLTLIGPMFVVAKLLVGLGLRSDLVPYLGVGAPVAERPAFQEPAHRASGNEV